MTHLTVPFDAADTGLLVVDPYNDFISEGGKIWPRIQAVAEANQLDVAAGWLLRAARTVSRSMTSTWVSAGRDWAEGLVRS